MYYVEESICPIRDADGQITHFVSNGRDRTERLRLEAQLLQAQKMVVIGQLAGGVAHDFNNLLIIITSYSELALDAIPQHSPLEAKIQEILQAARRAAELTRQLLAFSRKQPQALRVVELNSVVSTIAKTLPRLIGEDIDFIWVYGEPGSGTVFKIYLPCVNNRHDQCDAESSDSQCEKRGSETILLVEDEVAVRRATAEFLLTPGI